MSSAPAPADGAAPEAARGGGGSMADPVAASVACPSTCSVLPGSTVPAAAPSTRCAPARRGGSTSPDRSSAASMWMTSRGSCALRSTRPNPGAAYNLCDDNPAPGHEVTAYACELLGVEPPPLVPFEQADLSPDGGQLLCRQQEGPQRPHQIRTGCDLEIPRLPARRSGIWLERGRGPLSAIDPLDLIESARYSPEYAAP